MKMSACLAVLLGLATTTTLASSALADDTVPCEDMLSDLRAAVQTAQLSDADKTKVSELEDKGIERCNADDDARADEFFSQALKIVGK